MSAMSERRVRTLNLLPRPARRKLPRPGTAERVIAFVGLAVWCLVGYGIAVAAGFGPLPLGP